jgi:hypothetical protein
MRWWVWVGLVGCSGSADVVFQDAPPPDAFADSDGDGIADKADLCPGINTPINTDHDGDKRGDPCDPCPYLPTNDVTHHDDDTDGDGVGDGCDPHITQPIDHRVAFYGFYNSAEIAMWQQTGGFWSVSQGKLQMSSVSSVASILSPDMLGANITVTALVDVRSATTSTTLHATAGIQVKRNLATPMFHKCVLDQLTTTTTPTRVVNYQIQNSTGTGSTQTTPYANLVVANGHDYKESFNATTGTCSVDVPPVTVSQASGAAAPSQVGATAEYASVAIDYMFVVESD